MARMARDPTQRPELAIFGAADWIVNRYCQLFQALMILKEQGRLEWKHREPSFFHKHILPLVQSGNRALIYLTVAFQPNYFKMSISELTFLETSIENIFSTLNALRFKISSTLVADLFRIRVVFDCLDMKSKVAIPETPVPYTQRPQGMKIEVRNVSYAYDKDGARVLKDVNFTIEPGQIVSIVGYNGSGLHLEIEHF